MKKFFKEISHHGFALVEIMVALMLAALMFSIIPFGGSDPQHSKLEETIQDFDRAIRFSINESILRNSITRILINIDSDPMEYSVEYGPSGNLVLPTVADESRMSIREREQQQKIIKGIDAQFVRVEEFSKNTKKIPEGVLVLGVATSYFKTIRSEGEISIYFYPTGEKDNALIYFSTEQEMAWLDIPPFENITNIDYHIYTDSELVNLENSQDNKMKEVYDLWLKE